MGTWGTGLYSNDCSMDVRNDYRLYLKQLQDNDAAYKKIISEYAELMGTDEECYFWYALADTQWKLGRLLPEVKENACRWIAQKGGIEEWLETTSKANDWIKTLDKLQNQLDSPMPAEKRIPKPQSFVHNPWNIGDVYAMQFHHESTQERGLYGKYICFQKVADKLWCTREYPEGRTYSVLQVFDKVFDDIPTLDDLRGVRILPFGNVKRAGWHFSGTIFVMYDRIREYPKKHLFFIGNTPDNAHMPAPQVWDGVVSWKELAGYYLPIVYLSWQDFDYEISEEYLYSREKSKS